MFSKGIWCERNGALLYYELAGQNKFRKYLWFFIKRLWYLQDSLIIYDDRFAGQDQDLDNIGQQCMIMYVDCFDCAVQEPGTRNQEQGCPSGINQCIPKNIITGWVLNTKLVFVSRLVLWFGLTDLTNYVTITNTVSIGNDCLQNSYHVSGQNW